MALIEIADLAVTLPGNAGPVPVLRGVDFSLAAGECVGIVGESGSGKTMTALAILGLLPEGARASGEIRFGGTDLLSLAEPELCRLRGDRIAIVFQEPMTALNPLHPIGRQVAEPLRQHKGLGRRAARAEAEVLLERVGIEGAASRLDVYPHQLSGGQRQRVMIAAALACGPELLIADEPTTALDVSVQAQILDLLMDLVAERGMGLLLISHDLGVIAETCDRALVLYGGLVVERGPIAALIEAPAHPYTRGLLAALPQAGGGRLTPIPGSVPQPGAMPPGCPFAARCAIAIARCVSERPAAQALDSDPSASRSASGHQAACHRLAEAQALPGRPA